MKPGSVRPGFFFAEGVALRSSSSAARLETSQLLNDTSKNWLGPVLLLCATCQATPEVPGRPGPPLGLKRPGLNGHQAVDELNMANTDRKALARAIAARTKPRFIEIPRERRSKVYTEEQLAELRSGMTAEEYRRYLIRKFGDG